MKWKPANIGGKVYDLSHLHPFGFDFIVPEKGGRPEQVHHIDVVFSLHCFTRGIMEGENYATELAYSDSRETRLFDAERYRCSWRLPEIIRRIGERKCFHTGHDNFFAIDITDDAGRQVEYAVYFKVSRSSKRGRLTLYVQSAYIQDGVPRRRPRPRKPIRFSVIAHNVTAGRPINVPK